MFTALWVAGACLALAVVVLSNFRDRGRFGLSYCLATSGLWALSFAGGGVQLLVAPFPIKLWQLAAGAVAMYGCALLVSAGHPALLTAPYSEHARARLSAHELRHWYRMGWVLTALALAAAVTLAIAWAPDIRSSA